MNYRFLYITVWLAITFLVLVSLGEWLWGASEGRHWAEKMFYGVCHNLPDRTYVLGDECKMAVNTRCFGIFLGLWAGWNIIPWISKRVSEKKWPIYVLMVAVIVQIIDYSGNLIHIWENTNNSRALLGFFLGVMIPVSLADQFINSKRSTKGDKHG